MEKYKQELERRKQQAVKEREIKRKQHEEMFFKIMLDNNIDLLETEKIIITKKMKVNFDILKSSLVVEMETISPLNGRKKIKPIYKDELIKILECDTGALESKGFKINLQEETIKKTPLRVKLAIQKKYWKEFRTTSTWEIDCSNIK